MAYLDLPTPQFSGKYFPSSRGSGAASLAASLFNKNPSEAATPYLNELDPMMRSYLEPYINSGNRSSQTLGRQFENLSGNLPGLQKDYDTMGSGLPDLKNEYNSTMGMRPDLQSIFSQMMKDPSSILKRLGSGYEESPGFKFNYDKAMQAGNQAASAGGMLGSPAHQEQMATVASGLANQDFNSYLMKALGLLGEGTQGTQNLYSSGLSGNRSLYDTSLAGRQNLYNTGVSGLGRESDKGYQASTTLADALSRILMGKANNASDIASSDNENFGEGMGGLARLAMSFL